MTGLYRAIAPFALFLLACVPFREAILDPSKFPFGLDSVQHYSREAFVRRAFDAGVLPTWNPYEFSGFPSLADPQTGIFYPPNFVLRLLPLPAFLTWTVVVHIWIFGVGAYVLCLVCGVRPWPAGIAAAGLMLGGITMPRVYAGHLDVLRTVAWVPLAVALAMRSLDRGTFWPRTALVFVLALQVLGSFLQLVVYTVAVIASYAVFSALWPISGPRSSQHARTLFGQIALLVLLVGGLTAIQLVPTARLVLAAGRTRGVPFAEVLEPSIGVRDLLLFVAPSLDATVVSESWETSSYIGLLLVVIAPATFRAVRLRRQVRFFVLLAAATLLLAMGSPLYRLHHLVFPMFRIPGRFIVFWSMAICVLAAIALDWFSEPASATPGRNRGFGTHTLALGLATLIVALDVAVYAQRFVTMLTLKEAFAWSLPIAPTLRGRVLSLCSSELDPGDLSALGFRNVDGYNSYFLRDYGRLALLIQGETPGAQLTAYPRIGAVAATPNMPLLGLLNVTAIISCSPLNIHGLELISEKEPFFVYRNLLAPDRVAAVCLHAPAELATLKGFVGSEQFAPPCATNPADVELRLLHADLPDGRLEFAVSSSAPRTIVLSEPYYPERRAWIDGVETEIRKANLALSAIDVASGSHTVQVKYVPTSLYVGVTISMLTIAILLWHRLRQGEVR